MQDLNDIQINVFLHSMAVLASRNKIVVFFGTTSTYYTVGRRIKKAIAIVTSYKKINKNDDKCNDKF